MHSLTASRPALRLNRRGIALLLAATLALVPSVALAGGKWSASAPIQQGNASCGADLPQLPVIGSVEFARKGASLAMTFHLDGAAPSATYQASVWSGGCEMLAELGSITTNADGDATASFSVRVKGQSFFATINGANGYNDTTIVP